MLRSANWAKAEMAECPGPTEIGNIEISPEELDVLIDQLGNVEYFRMDEQEWSSLLDPLQEKQLGISISNEAKQILTRLVGQFRDIINNDLSETSDDSTQRLDFMEVAVGRYSASDIDIHVDGPQDPGFLRYGVTITGPPTIWVNESVRTDNFELKGDGELINISEIKSPLVPSEVGKVYRFTKACDPHTSPLSEESVFRITFFTGTSPVIE